MWSRHAPTQRLPPRPGLAQQWTRTASPPSTGLHMMHISTGRCMQVSKQSGSVRDGHQGSRGHQPRGHPWQRPGIQNRKTTHLRPACLSGCPGSAQQWTRTAPPPSTSLHMMHINTGRGMRMSKQSCSVRDGHQGSPGHHTAPWPSPPHVRATAPWVTPRPQNVLPGDGAHPARSS